MKLLATLVAVALLATGCAAGDSPATASISVEKTGAGLEAGPCRTGFSSKQTASSVSKSNTCPEPPSVLLGEDRLSSEGEEGKPRTLSNPVPTSSLERTA